MSWESQQCHAYETAMEIFEQAGAIGQQTIQGKVLSEWHITGGKIKAERFIRMEKHLLHVFKTGLLGGDVTNPIKWKYSDDGVYRVKDGYTLAYY